MAYAGKTNWQLNEIVKPEDMNRIEQGVIDAHENLLTHKTDTNSHTDIRNKFNEFVKGVTGSNATLTITKGNGATSAVTVNNVANATNASKATQDSTGQQINTTYIKGLSVSGATLTITKGNGATSTATINQTAGMLPATRVLQGGGTKLYSYNGGLSWGDITLSQAFTNFKYLVIFIGNEHRGQKLCASTVETVALYQAMAGNATYWPGNVCASNAYALWLTEDSHYPWAIYNIKGGSSTTYFKYSNESAEDTFIFSIYGIN